MKYLTRLLTDRALFAICLLFYLLFPLIDGPVWCVDSLSYTTMHITREPLYPTFLWIFRSIFGEGNYLMPVVLVQSVFAAYASWKLGMVIKGQAGGNRVMALLSIGFQLFVTFLCRFVANRGSAYNSSIMTEGLGMSLYLLFVLQLYQYILEEKGKNLAGAACLAVLLINLRKQMMITLCLLAAVFILYYLIKKQRLRKLLLLLALTVALLYASKLTDRIYNYCVRGAWIEHSGNSMGLLCTLLYTADEEDAALFKDEVLKGLYLEMQEKIQQQRVGIGFAPAGWEGLTTHYADSYDDIGYGIINPVIQGYIRENYDLTEVGEALKYDEYCNAMAKTLAGQEKGELLAVYSTNTLKGFINSVARMHPLLNVAAILLYVLYLALYALVSFKKKNWQEPDRSLTLAEIALGGIIINSLVVGAMIFCQPRYMIYSMGLFYSALSLMVYDLYRR